jgi:hypothetical protein
MKIRSKVLSKGLELSLFAFSFVAMSGCGVDSAGASGASRSMEDFAQVGLCLVTCLLIAKQITKLLSKRQATRS